MKHKKDAYYFSHDSNAKDDPKCVLLIEQLGLEGYGIYWILVETLRDQPNFTYPLKLISALARRYNTTSEKMKAVVMGYDLFIVENDSFFFSSSLIQRMNLYLDKKAKLSQAGKKGAQVKKDKQRSLLKATLELPFNPLEANKEKEIKTNKNLFSKEISVENIKVPNDGANRRLERFIERLEEYKISTEMMINVIELSNYGEIGSPIWELLDEIRDRQGTKYPIKFPTEYLKKCLGI